jgi:hypothetical protein
MSLRARRFATLAMASLFVAGIPYVSIAAADQTTEKLKTWDTDKDGTLDLAEAKAAAEAKFASLDPDGDGKLDAKEAAAAHISASTFARADSDKDGSIDKAEYLRLVAKRFKAADSDKDGTISAAELDTKAGAALMALLN